MQTFKDILEPDFKLLNSEQDINESSLSRIWGHTEKHDCGMMSACRGDRDSKENYDKSMELKAKLLKLGYGVTKIDGNYIEDFGTDNARKVKELSWFIVDLQDTKNLKEDLKKLGRFYIQDSIAFGEAGGAWVLVGTSKTAEFPGFNREIKLSQKKFGTAGQFFSSIKNRPFMFENIDTKYQYELNDLDKVKPFIFESIITPENDFELETFSSKSNVDKWYYTKLAEVVNENKIIDNVICESSLSRAYQHIQNYDIAFISACRYSNTRDENLKHSKELKAKMLTLGFGVTKIGGGFIENKGTSQETPVEELSYFVINKGNLPYDEFEKNIVTLGVYYNQDSVIVGKKGGIDLTEITTNNETDKPKYNRKLFKNISYGKIDTFYTRFKHNSLVIKENEVIGVSKIDTLKNHGWSGSKSIYETCSNIDVNKLYKILKNLK